MSKKVVEMLEIKVLPKNGKPGLAPVQVTVRLDCGHIVKILCDADPHLGGKEYPYCSQCENEG